MSDPSPARGNFHVNPGLLSLPFSGILHNTQFSQFPHIIKLFIVNKISKIFEKVKQTNKYEDTNMSGDVAMSGLGRGIRELHTLTHSI